MHPLLTAPYMRVYLGYNRCQGRRADENDARWKQCMLELHATG